MTIIFDSGNFIVEAPEKPLVDRNDGGHIVIHPKNNIPDRQHLTPRRAIELMRLTIVAGQAMTTVMTCHGIEIGRINYQDNGNWSVFKPGGAVLHIHLYGRAKNAVYQRYGQACFFPHRDEQPAYYEPFQPLTSADVMAMRNEIQKLLDNQKYSDSAWCLT